MFHASQVPLFVAIGIAAGVLSGLIGIGGGILIVPALILLAGFSPSSASGTSLAVLLLPVGLAAVFEYYRNGHVNIPAAAIMAVSFAFAAWGGAILSKRINPAMLRLSFGVFIAVVGCYIAMTAKKG